MQIVSIKDLRDNLAEIVEQVAIGKKTFIVSKFGKKKVVLSAYKEKSVNKSKKKVDLTKLPMYGMWKDREDMKDPSKWVANLRKRQSSRFKNL